MKIVRRLATVLLAFCLVAPTTVAAAGSEYTLDFPDRLGIRVFSPTPTFVFGTLVVWFGPWQVSPNAPDGEPGTEGDFEGPTILPDREDPNNDPDGEDEENVGPNSQAR